MVCRSLKQKVITITGGKKGSDTKNERGGKVNRSASKIKYLQSAEKKTIAAPNEAAISEDTRARDRCGPEALLQE